MNLYPLIGLLFLSFGLTAQPHLIQAESFTTDKGLSHNAVSNITEDSRGLLWLSTRYGVNRFDGHEFRLYTREKHGLHDNKIATVLEDRDGTLWMLTGINGHVHANFYDEFGYTLFNPHTERKLRAEDYLPADARAALAITSAYVQLPDRTLFFLAPSGQYLLYRGRGNYTVGHVALSKNRVGIARCLAVGDGRVEIQLGNEPGEVRAVVVFNTRHRGIESSRSYTASGYRAGLYPIRRASNGEWFIQLMDEEGRTGYFQRYDGQDLTVRHLTDLFPELAPYAPVSLHHIDVARNRYFVTTHEAGLLILQPDRGIVATIPELHVSAFGFTDRYGHYYHIDQRNGMTRYLIKPSAFQTLDLPSRSYRGLTVGAGDRLWLCVDRSVYDVIGKPESGPDTVYPHNQNVLRDRRGDIWVGPPISLASGNDPAYERLYRYPGGGTEAAPIIYRTDTLLNPELWSIWEDPRDGSIWAAGTDGKITRTTRDQGKTVVLPFVRDARWPAQVLVYDFVRHPDGTLWIATAKGLYHLDAADRIVGVYAIAAPGEFHLPADQYHHVYIDKAGIFWLSTGDAGLLKWSPEGNFPLRQFTLADGMPSMVVHASYEDSLGFLWLPTEAGIAQLHRETELVEVYGPALGTSDSEYNRISHYRHPDGTLYFGGMNGITKFHPRAVHRLEERVPGGHYINLIETRRYDPVQKAAFNLPPGGIELLPEAPRAMVHFLTDPARTGHKLTARVLGVERAPRVLEDDQFWLRDIPYGRHQLRLRAVDNGGQVLEERVIPLRVWAPYYLRWWFLLGSLLVIVALARLLAKWENRRLRSLVAERTGELRERDRMKTRFFTNVSHELRTPLTLIMAALNHMLANPQLDDESFRTLRRAHSSSRRLRQLVDDILNLVKLDRGGLVVEREPTPARSYFHGQLELFSSLAEERGVTYRIDVVLPEGLLLEVDRPKTQAIVHNLVSNALKFTPRGRQVTARVRWHDDLLNLVVSDTGRGITEVDQRKLFDRFYQARYAGQRAEGGTGIGLAICQEYASLLGGAISLRSQFGAGSTFSVLLPAEQLMGAAATKGMGARTREQWPSRPGAVKRSPPPGAPNVLIVEDHPDLRAYLGELLGTHYHVTTAENGRLALAHLRGNTPTPDLIVTDLMMPEMDGFTLLGHLRHDHSLQLIPVIVLSARASLGDRLAALRTGVDDYLPKPFAEAELLQRATNLIDNARARRAALREATLPDTIAPFREIAETGPAAVAPATEAWLAEVEALVLEHLADPDFGNEDLAALLFTSSRTLGRHLRQATGLTTNKFMLEIRLQAARRYFETQPTPTLGWVAQRVGFRKPSYLGKKYRERFGSRPQ